MKVYRVQCRAIITLAAQDMRKSCITWRSGYYRLTIRKWVVKNLGPSC